MIQKLKKSKGFTLIEMLVVIAIIAVLVSIIVPTVSNSTLKAKAAADAANLRSLQASATISYMENGDKVDKNDLPSGGKIVSKSDGTTEATLYVYQNQIIAVFGESTVDDYAKVAGGETTAVGKSLPDNATEVTYTTTSN